MSADNWTVCPRCHEQRLGLIDSLEQGVKESYGKIPMDEHDRLRSEASDLRDEIMPRSWREDYEFYLEDGELHVSYRGSCSTCNLSKTFAHTEQVWP